MIRARRPRKLAAAALAFGLALGAATARADVIYLTSGGIVKGQIVSEGPRDVVVRTAGGETVIAREEIERIERGASNEAMYRERLKKIPFGDAEGHYQLGLWLKRINLRDFARDEFQKTVMLDPEHKFAREELGYVRVNDRWSLPSEKDEDAVPAGASRARTVAPTRPEPERPAVEAPPLKLDASGLSADLTKLLGALDKDKDARAAAWAKLQDAESAECDRLATALLAPFSKSREAAWKQLVKVVPGAEPIQTRVPAEGASAADAEKLRDELKPHLAAYRAGALAPAIDATVAVLEKRAAASQDKLARAIRGLVKDWKQDSANKRREKALQWWVAARDEALRVIFDLKIYPDENHGRAGQPIVDEKVEKVRETWQFFDPMIQRDVAAFQQMTEQEAKATAQKIDDARARRSEAHVWLDRRGAQVQPTPIEEIEPVFEALIRYRAGDFDGVEKIALAGAWEKELLRRLRDQRVMAWNESFRSGGRKVEKGKQPIGEEVEQVKITNEYRQLMGRAALELEPRLLEAARGHSEEMTRLGYFAHESPVGANKTPEMRMKNAGYAHPGGENISMGSEAPKATHIAWYNSAPHHRNILSPDWAALGSGKDGPHWTQDFGPAGTLRR